jgi:hypothetical protein
LLDIKCQAGVELRLIKFQGFVCPLPRLGVRFGAMRRRIAVLSALTTEMAQSAFLLPPAPVLCSSLVNCHWSLFSALERCILGLSGVNYRLGTKSKRKFRISGFQTQGES